MKPDLGADAADTPRTLETQRPRENLRCADGVRKYDALRAQIAGRKAPETTETTFYTDKRMPRDDPYADVRW